MALDGFHRERFVWLGFVLLCQAAARRGRAEEVDMVARPVVFLQVPTEFRGVYRHLYEYGCVGSER